MAVGGYDPVAYFSRNEPAKGSPKVWATHEDALYLNVNRGTQKKLLKDISGFIEKADENWPGIL